MPSALSLLKVIAQLTPKPAARIPAKIAPASPNTQSANASRQDNRVDANAAAAADDDDETFGGFEG